MLLTEPTDVPPNFNTFITNLLKLLLCIPLNNRANTKLKGKNSKKKPNIQLNEDIFV